jgi:hypothetical protein
MQLLARAGHARAGETGCLLTREEDLKGTASKAAEKLCFVSGHDFSRAIND